MVGLMVGRDGFAVVGKYVGIGVGEKVCVGRLVG